MSLERKSNRTIGSAGILVAAAALAAIGHGAGGAEAAPKAGRVAKPHVTGGPSPRLDLPQEFLNLLCDGGASKGEPTAAWQAGFFDAQVEVRLLEPIAGAPLTDQRIERGARALAKTRKAGGYAFGWCPDRIRGWAVAMPSPSPLRWSGNRQQVKVPLAALNERCSSWRADFAAAGRGQPVNLAVARGIIDARTVGNGTVSITCQPSAPRWLGPVLWYLLPVGTGPAATPPEIAALQTGPLPPAGALAAWINSLRRAEALAPLTWPDEVRTAADLLTAHPGVTHDRQLLTRVAARTKDTGYKLEGEDRVRAASLESMAWLLWNSPRHRSLLLDRRATAGGVSVREMPDGSRLAVIATATAAALTTAGKAGDGKKQ